MWLSILVLIYNERAVLPCTLLSVSMVPFASFALVNGALSWILPRRLTKRLDDAVYSCYLNMCLFIFENISGIDLIVSGDVAELLERGPERALVLSNHQTNVDWAVVCMLAARHSPRGSIQVSGSVFLKPAMRGIRFMVKHSIQYVPLFGWYVQQNGYIFVRRDSGKGVSNTKAVHQRKLTSREKASPITNQLSWLDSLERPAWLLIFPEGTRMNARTLEKSINLQNMRRALEKSRSGEDSEEDAFWRLRNTQPPLCRVLSPRVGGFHLALEGMPSLEAVYDFTIAYSQTRSEGSGDVTYHAPGMFSFVCCPFGSTVHVHVRRFDRADIPDGIEQRKKWMEKLFIEKEQRINIFQETGSFDRYGERLLPTLPIGRTFSCTCYFLAALTVGAASHLGRSVFSCTVAASPLLMIWLKLKDMIS